MNNLYPRNLLKKIRDNLINPQKLKSLGKRVLDKLKMAKIITHGSPEFALANALPYTLCRVAVFNGNLADAVENSGIRCEPLSVGLGNTVKYAQYSESQDPYLLMVSQQKEKRITTVQGVPYNCQLTVTSRKPEVTLTIAQDFQKRTGMEFREAPSKLVQLFQNIGLSFLVFEKHGDAALEFLKRLG